MPALGWAQRLSATGPGPGWNRLHMDTRHGSKPWQKDVRISSQQKREGITGSLGEARAFLGWHTIAFLKARSPEPIRINRHLLMQIPGPWTKLTESRSFMIGPSELYILSSSPGGISALRSLTSSRVRAQQPDKDNRVSSVDGWNGLGRGTEA